MSIPTLATDSHATTSGPSTVLLKTSIRQRVQFAAPPVSFRPLVTERKLFLALVDLIIINLALVLGLSAQEGYLPEWPHPGWVIVLSGLWAILGSALGLYDLRLAAKPGRSAFGALKAGVLVAVVFFLIPYVTPTLPSSRFEWAVFGLVAAGGLAAWRWLYGAALAQAHFANAAIIAGAGWAGETIAREIREHLPVDYDLLGFVDDDPAKEGKLVCDLPVIGQSRDLTSLALAKKANQVILAITNEVSETMFRSLLECQEHGVAILPMPWLYEELSGKIAIDHIGQALHLLVPITYSPTRPLYHLFKRSIDLVLGIVGLLLLLILLPVVWVTNAFISPGPLLYRQMRVGKNGRPFQLYKLRTMVPDAESGTGAVWAKEGDSRITPFGRLLRKTHLDEVPQFWNVLKGEMSLIGPRPERPEFDEWLARDIPFYNLRHSVEPGLTGWAQVNLPYGSSIQDSRVKLQYDLYYVKRGSVFLELLIMIKTAAILLKLEGR